MEQYLKDQIKITLSGTKELTYKINLYNDPFVSRWFDEFKNIIKQKLILEKKIQAISGTKIRNYLRTKGKLN